MKKTSAHFAVPVTTRDTSHSVTDDGTVGLCHADPQGEVKSLRPFPLGNGEGSREQKKRIQTQKIKEINRKDETIMAKDGTSRGGARPGAGRKPKAITEKVAAGNPGGRKLTVVDFGENAAELTGEEMPPVSEFMKAVQKDGSVLCAEDISRQPGPGFESAGVTISSPPRSLSSTQWRLPAGFSARSMYQLTVSSQNAQTGLLQILPM